MGIARAAALRPPRRRVRTRENIAATRLSTDLRRRLGWLIDVLGNNQVAELLQVNRSQPSRWRTGREGLAPPNQRKVLDLDYVIARLHQLWTPDVAAIWLRSPNAHLNAAVPLEVLRQRGVTDVIEALDATAEGAYA